MAKLSERSELNVNKTPFRLLGLNFTSILLFEVIYKALGSFILFPILSYGFKTLFLDTAESYLSIVNVRELFKTPLCYLYIGVCMVIIGYYLLLEISVLSAGFHASKNNVSLTFSRLIVNGFSASLRFFKPVNWIAFVMVYFYLPFLQVGITSGLPRLLYLFSIIESLTGVLVNKYILIAVLCLSVIIALIFTFSFVFFFENKINYFAACYLSLLLYRRGFLKTLGYVFTTLGYILLFFLGAGIILLSIGLITYLSLLSFSAQTVSEIYDTVIKVLSPISVLITMLVSTLTPMMFFSAVYNFSYHPVRTQYHYKHRIFRFGSSILLIVLLLGFSLYKGRLISLNVTDDQLMKIQTGGILTGHQGNSVDTLGNTTASIQKAIQNGADYVEIDVQRTADGVIVVAHSDDISTTAGNYKISELNYDSLKDLELLNDDHITPSGQSVPTLTEVIDLTKDKVKLNIELKPSKNSNGFVEEVVRIATEKGILESSYLASGKYPYLEKIESINSDIKTLYLTNSELGYQENSVVDAISINKKGITKDMVNRVHLLGKTIHVWTLENEEEIKQMIDYGVDDLIVNNVRLGAKVLSENRPGELQTLFSILMFILIQL